MKYLILILVVLFSCGKPADKLFKAKKSTSDVSLKGLSTVMEIDQAVLSQLVANKSETLDIQIPYKGDVLDLELTASNLFAPDFVVRTDKYDVVAYEKGLFYTGKVKGDGASMVSVSLFKDDIVGIISSPTLGDLNLGKTQEVALEYTLADPSAIGTFDFQCATPEEGIDDDAIQLLREKGEVSLNAVNSCASVDFEMSYSNFQQFGSVAAVTNWITAIFSSVKTVYANEGINIVIKSIFVHTSPDGYNSNPATALNELRSKRTGDPNFTGSIVHFVRGKTSGFSGIAYVGVTCIEQYQYGLSDVQFNYNPYPSYSWTVSVLCHEIGHQGGSAHTHSCTAWKDGKPIDGCGPKAGYSEGSCPPGPIPAKGYIMSYCHLLSNVGISFSLGFGEQSGNAIRAHIGATTCANCGLPPTPTCTDGVKNGTEIGVDCGGACPPCPVISTCTDLVKNGTETGIDCGGNCPPCGVEPPTGAVNVSQGKPASQSTNYRNFTAVGVNDGNLGSYSHSDMENKPWVQIDLVSSHKIVFGRIINRKDCCNSRITHFRVFISDVIPTSFESSGFVYEYKNPSGFPIGTTINIPNLNVTGRYARLWANNGASDSWLHVAEFQLFGSSTVVCKDTVYRVPRVVLIDSTGQICR